jgi:iron complex transport system ATP-binding protein
MNTRDVVLRTNSLKVGFRQKAFEKVLFDNLNLQLEAGRLVCFMGPNGVGKSSLIRTIAGLQPSLAGSVDIVNSDSSNTPEILSVVLTDRIIAQNLTVRDLVAFGRYPYVSWNTSLTKKDEELIDDAMNLLGLGHLSNSAVNELSDGQMQMAMIARAIAQNTPVILLDEPTAHLDLDNRVEIMKLLRRLTRKMNKSILVSTHELDLALQTADITWLAGRDGKIISGVPEDLVLNGSFDEIFNFKGFDLRTGRIIHEVSNRPKKIMVSGDGPVYLWTRNALERSGLVIAQGVGDQQTLKVVVEEQEPRWKLTFNNRQYETVTIAELIEVIGSIDCEIPE